MKYLPIGLNVRDKKCVVVGGGRIGTRKVETLLGAGGAVHVISPAASPRIEELADSGKITWSRETFTPHDLDGALLAVAATDDEGLNARLVEVGREMGVLTCDASSAERSELIFGALHHGDGLTIAVFTDGEDPSRSRATRDRIAALVSDPNGPEPPAID
jgi:siroheme synthase-like protein